MIRLKPLLKEQGKARRVTKVIGDTIEDAIANVHKEIAEKYSDLSSIEFDLIGNKPQFTLYHGDGKLNGKLYIIVAPEEKLLKQKVFAAMRNIKTQGRKLLSKPLDRKFKSTPEDHIIDADGNPMPIYWQALVAGPKGAQGNPKNPESNSLWGSI